MNYLDFKKAQCKNCYKCLKNCAIKAIKIEENQAKIIEERCILCGKCTLICPQNAKKVHSELDDIKQLLKENKVIATVAPSFIANFNVNSLHALEKALKKVGFYAVEETARGARIVINEYEKLIDSGKYKNLIDSSCPATNSLIKMYYPEAMKYLAPVDSPVIAHAKLIKKENPDSKIVFIGPCIAKKKECKESGLIDGVLTFEELQKLFEEYNINLEDENEIGELKENQLWNQARFYPISRGVIKAFTKKHDDFEYIAVEGIEKCKEVLEEIEKLDHFFIELSTCEGSCVNGPASIKQANTILGNAKVRKFVRDNYKEVEENNFDDINLSCEHTEVNLGNNKEPTEEQIKEILAKTGKYEKEDELNCGACGYSTCREKAWAVFNGYADIEMCVPYMREKAENMSYEIIQKSPNGIILLDNDLNVLDMNDKAAGVLAINKKKSKDKNIAEVLNENINLLSILQEKKNITAQRVEIEKTGKFIELSVNYIKDHNMLFATLRDITERIVNEQKMQKLKNDTIVTADEVVKKQMRVAQEIASLLGETTAESKVALVNLKKMLEDEAKNES